MGCIMSLLYKRLSKPVLILHYKTSLPTVKSFGFDAAQFSVDLMKKAPHSIIAGIANNGAQGYLTFTHFLFWKYQLKLELLLRSPEHL